MTSRAQKEAFVWIWLPGETEPVVAGRLEADSSNILFNYGKSFMARIGDSNPAIAIYEPKLGEVDKKLLWRRQFLNPYFLE